LEQMFQKKDQPIAIPSAKGKKKSWPMNKH
jgi:hypothetical protein